MAKPIKLGEGLGAELFTLGPQGLLVPRLVFPILIQNSQGLHILGILFRQLVPTLKPNLVRHLRNLTHLLESLHNFDLELT